MIILKELVMNDVFRVVPLMCIVTFVTPIDAMGAPNTRSKSVEKCKQGSLWDCVSVNLSRVKLALDETAVVKVNGKFVGQGKHFLFLTQDEDSHHISIRTQDGKSISFNMYGRKGSEQYIVKYIDRIIKSRHTKLLSDKHANADFYRFPNYLKVSCSVGPGVKMEVKSQEDVLRKQAEKVQKGMRRCVERAMHRAGKCGLMTPINTSIKFSQSRNVTNVSYDQFWTKDRELSWCLKNQASKVASPKLAYKARCSVSWGLSNIKISRHCRHKRTLSTSSWRFVDLTKEAEFR